MAKVTLKNVEKFYGKVHAVKDASIDIEDQEFLCLLGPSGCGKSTTLRMIAGLETITKGEIYIGDLLINDLAPKDRNVAMVFENYALYPHKNVFENIAFPLLIRKTSPEEVQSRIQNAARILEIQDLLDRSVNQLSGGQKQRVAIGRAIVREPQVFLMDEPISHLDAKLRTHMRGELKHLQRVLKTTMVYVTHDQLEAISMADRIVIMNLGEIQQVGTPDEIFNNPSNVFVADFVGDPPMNFIDCSLERIDEKLVLSMAGINVALSVEREKMIPAGAAREVILGIRPQDIKIHATKPKEGDAAVGRVWITKPEGRYVVVEVEVGSIHLRIERI